LANIRKFDIITYFVINNSFSSVLAVKKNNIDHLFYIIDTLKYCCVAGNLLYRFFDDNTQAYKAQTPTEFFSHFTITNKINRNKLAFREIAF